MAYRDWGWDTADAWQQFVQGMAQGQLTGAAQRREDELLSGEDRRRREESNIAEMRRRSEINRSEARTDTRTAAADARTDALTAATREREDDQIARASAHDDLRQMTDVMASLRAEDATPQTQQAISVLSTLMGQLQGVVAAPQGGAAGAYQSIMTGGVPQGSGAALMPGGQGMPPTRMPSIPASSALASGAGLAAEAGRTREEDTALRTANSSELRDVSAQLRTPVNTADPTSVANAKIALQGALALQGSPVMPLDEQRLADLATLAEAVHKIVENDPAGAELRDLALQVARNEGAMSSTNVALGDQSLRLNEQTILSAAAQAEIDRLGVRGAELSNAAAEQGIALGQLTYTSALEQITAQQLENEDRRSASAYQALTRWRETGLLSRDDPHYAQVMQAVGAKTPEDLERRGAENYASYNRRLVAQDELVDLAVAGEERRVEMQGLEIDQTEYLLDRQPIVDALADGRDIGQIVEQAILNGDRARLMDLYAQLEGNPNGPVAGALRAGGFSAESLLTQMGRAEANESFQLRGRELALTEAGLALDSARMNQMVLGADVRMRVAQSLTPDDIDAWYAGLPAADRALVGGDVVVRGMKRDSTVNQFLSGEPVRANAYQQAMTLMSTTPEPDRQEEAASAIFEVLFEATGDGNWSGAMADGALGAWQRGDTAFGMELQKHDMWMKLTEAQRQDALAQAAARGRGDATGAGANFDDTLELYKAQEDLTLSQRDVALDQMAQAQCITMESRDNWQGGRAVTSPGARAGESDCREYGNQLALLAAQLETLGQDMAALRGAGSRTGFSGAGPAQPRPATVEGTSGLPIPSSSAAGATATAASAAAGAGPPAPVANENVPAAREAGLSRETTNQLVAGFRAQTFTEAELRADLIQFGFTPDQADALTADIKAAARRREPSPDGGGR